MTRAASEMSYFREFERTQLRRRRRRPPVWGDATTTDLERKLAEGKEGMERRRHVPFCLWTRGGSQNCPIGLDEFIGSDCV